MNRKLKLEELKRIDTVAFRNSEKSPVVIVLDNIRSLNNIGSVFRTADAFRIEAIYLCGVTAQPPHRDIHKTALGATQSVKWEYFEDTLEAIQRLKDEKYEICAVEQAEQTVSLDCFQPQLGKVALILGNEVEGVQQSVIEQSDLCIEVPQFGTKHSLNISVCTGIVLWEVVKSLGLPSK